MMSGVATVLITKRVVNEKSLFLYPVSPDGLTVSSQLIAPTTKANNNITVISTVEDALFNYEKCV